MMKVAAIVALVAAAVWIFTVIGVIQIVNDTSPDMDWNT